MGLYSFTIEAIGAKLERGLDDRSESWGRFIRRFRMQKLDESSGEFEDDAQTQVATSFRFRDLPVHLRYAVYRCLLDDAAQSPVRSIYLRGDHERPMIGLKLPAAAHVCRTIRNEILPVFFGLYTFRFEIETRWPAKRTDHIAASLKHFAPHAHLLQNILVSMRMQPLLRGKLMGLFVRIDISEPLAPFTRLGGLGYRREAAVALVAELETYQLKGRSVENFSSWNTAERTLDLIQLYGWPNPTWARYTQ